MAKKKSRFAGKVRSNAQKTKQAGSQYGYLNLPRGVSMFSAEPGGRARLDFIPYEVTDPKHPDRDDENGIAVPGELWYKRPFKIHRNIGSANDAVVCLSSIGKKCPICEHRALRMKENASKEETDALKTSLRNLYIVVPKKSKKYEEKPHIWDISQYLFQNLLTEELEEDENYEVFPDLEEGLTLRIRFDSTVIGNSKPFADTSRIDFEERDEQYNENILDDVPNLDEVLSVLSYSQLEAKFFEMEDEVEDEGGVVEEDDDAPSTSPSRSRKASKKEPEPEEEPEEEEEPPKEEKPKTTTRRTTQKKDQCTACEGTGKNSKGKTCRICRGSGKKREEEKKEDENRCPHGHTFADDCEQYDECDSCDLWDDCIEEKEKNE